MVKKITLLFLLLITIFSIGLVGCKDSESTEFGPSIVDEEVSVGGTQIEKTVVVEEIFEANDLHVTTAITKDTLINEAYVVLDDVKIKAELNLDKVTFGTGGAYDIVYSYGNFKVEKKLYIYSAPTISGETTISLEYKEALTSCAKGVTAKDSFGNAIDVVLINDDGMCNIDGSINVGSFNVTFGAYDRAGQKVTHGATVTVNSLSPPAITAKDETDVTETGGLEIDLGSDINNFAFLSIDGAVVPDEYLTTSGNKKIIDSEYLFSKVVGYNLIPNSEDGREFVLRVATTEGMASKTLKITDEKAIKHDISGVVDYFENKFAFGQTIELPSIKYLNKYQNIDTEITVEKAGSAPIIPSQNTFRVDENGAWQLIIDFNRAGQAAQTLNLNLYNDLGFDDGMIISANNKLSAHFLSGYDYTRIYVKTSGTNTVVARWQPGESIEAFDASVLALNKSKRYEIEVVATKGANNLKQTAQFRVLGSDVIYALGDSSLSLLTPANKATTAFAYVNKDLAGISGAYQYNGRIDTTISEKDAFLKFDENAIKDVKAGDLFTFKIKANESVNLVLTLGGQRYYAWGKYACEAGGTDLKYTTNHISFFKQDGTGLLNIRNDKAPPLSIKDSASGEWLNVVFNLPANLKSGDGISVYPGTIHLGNAGNVYFTDMTFSKATKCSALGDGADTSKLTLANSDKTKFEFKDSVWNWTAENAVSTQEAMLTFNANDIKFANGDTVKAGDLMTFKFKATVKTDVKDTYIKDAKDENTTDDDVLADRVINLVLTIGGREYQITYAAKTWGNAWFTISLWLPTALQAGDGISIRASSEESVLNLHEIEACLADVTFYNAPIFTDTTAISDLGYYIGGENADIPDIW